MIIDVWATTQKLMEETGLSADQILRMDMQEYARLTGRQSPARAATQTLDAEYEAPAPQGQEQPPAGVQEPPQGIDPNSAEYFLAWRQNRARGGEGRGIFDSVGSRSDEYTAAVRAQSGRTMYGQSNVVEPPRLEGRFVNHDEQRDNRTAAQRFSTPGNAFNL